ncbi:hypothetical protein EVAR_99999_1 [Eumeta japonica]|uniref:Uncharacterized protein n=1 Tax=Eumeta variegata TaxID=151549 RepID=A0A4C2A8A1_EUMVA|nr:hypothetical protein EVAR_99999_1 [Eumeta japonica]
MNVKQRTIKLNVKPIDVIGEGLHSLYAAEIASGKHGVRRVPAARSGAGMTRRRVRADCGGLTAPHKRRTELSERGRRTPADVVTGACAGMFALSQRRRAAHGVCTTARARRVDDAARRRCASGAEFGGPARTRSAINGTARPPPPAFTADLA